MTRTVAPKAMYNREGFKVLGSKGKEGFGECKGGVDDKMEGDYGNPRLLVKPLEVVLRPYLDRSRFCKREMGGGAIEGPMVKLFVREIGVKGPKLSIRPPVLLGGKSVDKVGGTGGKRTLRKFRGDY